MAPVSTRAQPTFDVLVAGNVHSSSSSLASMSIGQGGRPHLIWQDSRLGDIIVASYGRESGAIENPHPIDDLGGTATRSYPRIVVTGPNIFASWVDCCGPVGGSGVLAVSYSTDSGATYSRNLFAPAQSAWEPDIATDGDALYLVWRDGPSWEPGMIMFSKLTIGTTSFAQTATLTVNNSLTPAVAVDKPNVYVAWVNSTGSLHFSWSTDGGQTFESPSEIDGGREAIRSTPRLASRGGSTYLVWQSQEPNGVHLRFALSTDNGLSFSDPVDLDEVLGFRSDLNPSLSIGQDGKIYVAWISYKFYLDSGLTVRTKSAPLSGGPWEEFNNGARKTGQADHVWASIVADSSSHYFLLYELVEKRQGLVFRELHLATDLPITSPGYWIGQWFGNPIAGVVLATTALGGSAGVILFLYRRQYGLRSSPSRIFGSLARFLRWRRRPRQE